MKNQMYITSIILSHTRPVMTILNNLSFRHCKFTNLGIQIISEKEDFQQKQ